MILDITSALEESESIWLSSLHSDQETSPFHTTSQSTTCKPSYFNHALWTILQAIIIPGKLVNLVLFSRLTAPARIRIYVEEPVEFYLNFGFQRGFSSSRGLFNYAIGRIVRQAFIDSSNVRRFSADLEFADYIILFECNSTYLQPIPNHAFFTNAGPEVNVSKTKVLSSPCAQTTSDICQ